MAVELQEQPEQLRQRVQPGNLARCHTEALEAAVVALRSRRQPQERPEERVEPAVAAAVVVVLVQPGVLAGVLVALVELGRSISLAGRQPWNLQTKKKNSSRSF